MSSLEWEKNWKTVSAASQVLMHINKIGNQQTMADFKLKLPQNQCTLLFFPGGGTILGSLGKPFGFPEAPFGVSWSTQKGAWKYFFLRVQVKAFCQSIPVNAMTWLWSLNCPQMSIIRANETLE